MLQILLGDNLLQVDVENLLATVHGRLVNCDVSIETPGTKKGLVKHVGPVGASHNDDLVCRVESVHFRQDLVEGSLALVGAAAVVGF